MLTPYERNKRKKEAKRKETIKRYLAQVWEASISNSLGNTKRVIRNKAIATDRQIEEELELEDNEELEISIENVK